MSPPDELTARNSSPIPFGLARKIRHASNTAYTNLKRLKLHLHQPSIYKQKKQMKITGIDHIVLTVKNIEKTVLFYESVLGMKSEIFGEERVALKFGNQKINLHEKGQEFEPKANKPVTGSEDLCFITQTKLEEAMEQVRSKGVNILEGPVTRTGAVGSIVSFYFRDPDENLIEVANYAKST